MSRVETILRKLVNNFAFQNDEGTWWGMDTDLGDCKEYFKEAESEITKLLDTARSEGIEECAKIVGEYDKLVDGMPVYLGEVHRMILALKPSEGSNDAKK